MLANGSISLGELVDERWTTGEEETLKTFDGTDDVTLGAINGNCVC